MNARVTLPCRIRPMTWALLALAVLSSITLPPLFTSAGAGLLMAAGLACLFLTTTATSLLAAVLYLASGRSICLLNGAIASACVLFLALLVWAFTGPPLGS